MPLPSALRVPRSALAALLLSSVLCSLSHAQEDPFAAGVRTTPWLSPADEQKAFKLPPGFEIQLVAAEPDIQKPLNMAFDERGRIWLTCSVEYPYAAPLDKPARDSIRVLEDTDGDGRFEKVHTFADGLNIPIGIYPYKGGCIAWSIPNIWHFEDTDSDGVCDKRTVLYGPFDHTRDVHGNCNAFRRGWDGWIYACHGFNNDSHVKGKDGNEVHLNSGNTFRFKLDGSRIEQFTHGQVNPFGMCFDDLFNIFTADCHSKPLTQLIRGGHYPSFGKPHDGLGFVPSMMEHLHGSTAICGVVCYSGENFPKEYRGNFLSGNVMTSRINQNKPEFHGSTIQAIEQPDFLSTTDPWFRPVDLQVGPDGALYILDFYNRIIGHYEVPLPHPGRDRTSGRIWRLVYKGDAEGTKPAGKSGDYDLTKLSIEQLIAKLDSPQLEHRLRVLNYVADTKDAASLDPSWDKLYRPAGSHQLASLVWLLRRLDRLTAPRASAALASDSPEARVHAIRALGATDRLTNEQRALVLKHLQDADPFVRRAVADVLAEHATPNQLADIVNLTVQSDADDALLKHGARLSLQRHLNGLDESQSLEFTSRWIPTATKQALNDVVSVAATAESPGACQLVLHCLARDDQAVSHSVDYQRLSRNAGAENLRKLIDYARGKFLGAQATKPRYEDQARTIVAIHAGIAQRTAGEESLTRPLLHYLDLWAQGVTRALLDETDKSSIGWTAVPVEGKPASESPWVIAARPCQDGVNDQPFYYSLPKGEQRTGIYRSAAFEIPAKLSFWLAGHSGFPGKPLNDGNWVRLRDATTHAVLAESRPPRNDTAQRVEWELKDQAGKQGYVELVDGDTADAYAWLAVGRFSLAALNPSDTARKQQLAAEIVGKLKLAELRPKLAELVAAPSTDGAARAAIGQALVSLEPSARAAALVSALNEPAIPSELRVAIGTTLARSVSDSPEETTKRYLEDCREVMKRAPSRLQSAVADTLAGDAAGADALLALVESGHASPRLLLAPSVSAKFATLKNEALDKRVSAATAKLPPASETLDKLILERRVSFGKTTPSLERGLAVFTKHCAVCHQIGGKGAVVGPQLDGIGGRGLERIVEDVLDPNRNVDVAFRTTTMRLTDGRVVSGLVRRAEGAQLVFADNLGKEFTVAKDEIDQETKTALSLMPANVPEIVPAEEFHDLVGYLLSQRATVEKKP